MNSTKVREATANAKRKLDDMWKHGSDEDDISVLKSALEDIVEALEALID